jgi:hypothetical protein
VRGGGIGLRRAIGLLSIITLILVGLPTVPFLGTPDVAEATPSAITTRISVSSAGDQGNAGSGGGRISETGQFVAFVSSASNLAAGDTNGVSDVFVHDRSAGTTTRVSVSSTGAQANGASGPADISADGRFVAFQSAASNLVSGDTNGVSDVFVRDRQTGSTTRVSVSSSGAQANGASSTWDLAISADGRYVTFSSAATNLVSGDTNVAADVFVRDRQTGATTRVSLTSRGKQSSGPTWAEDISGDGSRVLFWGGDNTGLVQGDRNGKEDYFVRDRNTGVTSVVSVSSSGQQGDRNINPYDGGGALSQDGRYAFFQTDATNLVPGDTNVAQDIFMRDLAANTTTRVSLTYQGNEISDPARPGVNLGSVSSDGRYLAFWSRASDIVPGDNVLCSSGSRNCSDVFVRDLSTGSVVLVSRNASRNQGDNDSDWPSISADGRFIAYGSSATNLVTGDTNGVADEFVSDRFAILDSAPPTVSLDRPPADAEVFHTETVVATAADDLGVAQVDFLVDGVVIGSDSSAPYETGWDTTAVADGPHTIKARATDLVGNETESQSLSVTVLNASSSAERVQADLNSGSIGVDDYLRFGMHSLFEPRLLSSRYQSTEPLPDSEEAYFDFVSRWDDVSQGTRDEITQFFADLDAGFFATQEEGGSAQALPDSSAQLASSQDVECESFFGFRGLPAGRCTYTTDKFVIRYAPEGFLGGIPTTEDDDGDGVPNKIEVIEGSLRAALAKYTNATVQTYPGVTDPLDFRVPGFPITVTIMELSPGSSDLSPPLPGTDIYLDHDTGGIYLPRHALFHVIEWRYVSLIHLLNRSIRFWMEASAEWAADESEPEGTSEETASYASNLPLFLGRPHFELDDTAGPLDRREYGGFILAQYLAQRFDGPVSGFIKRSWERIADADDLGAMEAIDDLLKTEEGVSGGLADVLPDFWQRTYRLEQGALGYDDDDVTDWREILSLDSRTQADLTEASPRPARIRVAVVPDETATGTTAVKPGGAVFIDFHHDFEGSKRLTLEVENRELLGGPPTSADIHLTLLSFGSNPTYPALCQAPPLPEELSLVNGVAQATIDIAADCRFSTLVVTHYQLLGGSTKVQDWAATFESTVSTISRMSVSSSGAEADSASYHSSISSDGRYIAFDSIATNLVPGDTNGIGDVFVHDRVSGTTERVSLTSAGDEPPAGPPPSFSAGPSISRDGRYVAFYSNVALVPEDTNEEHDVFVRDRTAGTTTRVSVGSNGEQVEQYAGVYWPSISEDGRYVAFRTGSQNIDPNHDGTPNLYVRDQQSGITEQVGFNRDPEADPEGGGDHPTISADGRYVVFDSSQELDPADDDGLGSDIYSSDRTVPFSSTLLTPGNVTDAGCGAGNNASPSCALSADGRYLLFSSGSPDLVGGDGNEARDVFIRDLIEGTIRVVSVSSGGDLGNGDSFASDISADGRYVVFWSIASNLVSGDTNNKTDVFIHDTTTGTTTRLSVTRSVDNQIIQGNGHSQYPFISEDGRYVVFESSASNLVPEDTNGELDVFLVDQGPLS